MHAGTLLSLDLPMTIRIAPVRFVSVHSMCGLKAVWVAEDPQEMASLRPIVSTIWDPHISLGQTPGRPTGFAHWQLSTPRKELDRLCPHIGFSPRWTTGYNGQLQAGVAVH
jgi:hypothetical protein